MKGGGIKKAAGTRRPAFQGALLDVLSRCIARKAENNEEMPGHCTEQLTEALGKGAYDVEGHKNEQVMGAANIGPFPESCTEAWAHVKKGAMENYGLTEGLDQKEWGKMGPFTEPKPANAKNKGAADRRRNQRGHGRDTGTNGGGDNAHEGQEDNNRRDMERGVMNQRMKKCEGQWRLRYGRWRGRTRIRRK